MRTIEFIVDGTNKWGWFTAKRKCRVESNLSDEDIFRSCWKSLPKRIERNWESISFFDEGEIVTVRKHWLKETGFDFNQSHERESI